ncbi:neprilysin-2-like isoform X2 [Chironomus tepperi]|uniref:neprilysin-2-like isoform X2 n=1 Tax=Chironomus tepperi TaxID=113505 RepID=UPI00391FA202
MCDDFYSFACNKFIQTTYTPDEKSIVNTESLLIDQLDENLLRILSKPIEGYELWPHKLAKYLYKNCMDTDNIRSMAYDKIHKLLNSLGGWPILMSNWHEENWSWEKFILTLRRFVGIGNGKNIFRDDISDGLNNLNIGNDDVQGITRNFENEEQTVLEHEYPIFMYQIAIALGALNTTSVQNELNEALELGKALNQLLNGRNFHPRSRIRAAEQKELKIELDFLRWIEIFDKFKLKSAESALVDHTKSVYDNLKDLKKKFSKRTFANYIVWRIIDFTTQFLDDNALESTLRLFKSTYGVIDREQRWKLCTRITRKYAELASGSLYVNDYFPKESRDIAMKMVQTIIDEFRRTIITSDWMDEKTKTGALNTLNNLKVIIGYDERLLNVEEVEKYYHGIEKNFTSEFLFLAMQLNIQQTDKSFQNKFRNISDWTLYAKPTTSKASYNRKDNSIYFAAAFFQPPNFDKNRPMSMNFGAIGSIIAHELTHCFDRFAEKINEWSESSIKEYVSRLKCFTTQYSSYIDPDINENLNGTVTVTEDTADNGGIKLAYRAYVKWMKTLKGPQSQLIALKYTPQQLFWISYAQFYCSVQRDEVKRSQLESHEVHSFDRFRVIGPLINAFEFSRDFNCSIMSRMNGDSKRCTIW